MPLALERQRWLDVPEFKASRVCTASFGTTGVTQRNHVSNKTKYLITTTESHTKNMKELRLEKKTTEDYVS